MQALFSFLVLWDASRVGSANFFIFLKKNIFLKKLFELIKTSYALYKNLRAHTNILKMHDKYVSMNLVPLGNYFNPHWFVIWQNSVCLMN